MDFQTHITFHIFVGLVYFGDNADIVFSYMIFVDVFD